MARQVGCKVLRRWAEGLQDGERKAKLPFYHRINNL
jgi:hypothetical protein